MHATKLLPLFFVALVAVVPRTAAAVDVTGAITGDVTWTAASNPYVLTGDVYINAGATLTIEPGVEVQAATSGGDTELIVRAGGNLAADASGGDPIVFRPQGSTVSGSWEGIVFEASALGTLSNVQIEYADYALEFTSPLDTNLTIDGVAFTGARARAVSISGTSGTFTLRGLDVDSTDGSTSVGVYASSQTYLRVYDSVFRGVTTAIQGSNTSLLVDHTIIDDGTYGVRADYTTNATWNVEVINCTILNQTEALRWDRNSSSSSRPLYITVEDSIFGENDYVARDAATSTYERATFSLFRRNVHWGGTLFYSTTPSSSSLNLNYNALLADPDNGDYEPTDRSPARYPNPENPASTLGAVPHAGAETGEGVHGFWYVDKTFELGSTTVVSGDMVIAPGATVTFLPDARFYLATNDVMQGGLDTSRVEIRVEGTLEADGTVSRPVQFTSSAASPARGDWYGIVIPSEAEAFNVSQVDLGYAYRGVSLYENDHIVAGSNIHHCSDAGVWISGGTPQVEDVSLHDNYRGVTIDAGANVTLTGVDAWDSSQQGVNVTNASFTYRTGRVFDNGAEGILITLTANPSRTATMSNLTVAHNAREGIDWDRNSSSSSRYLTINLTDSSVTHNAAAGVRDSASSTYERAAFNCLRSNSWGNGSSDWYSVTAGASCFSYNPLYADIDARDYAPTTHSPNRERGTSGAEVGALPYVGDLGPQLMGYLWDDYTFTEEGSPYTILGDLIVPQGTTVTFEPGAELRVVPSADGMGGGQDSNEAAIYFEDGSTAVFDGTGDPVVFTVDSDSPASGTWDGIYVTDGGDSAFDNFTVAWAEYGLHLTGPTAPTIEDALILRSQSSGIYGTDLAGGGTNQKVDVLASSIIGTGSGVGVNLSNSDADVRSTYITHTSTGINFIASTNGYYDLYAINNTIVHQGNGIVWDRNSSSSSRPMNVYLYNNVVAESTGYAARDQAGSTYERSNVTLRNNNWFDSSSVSGTFATNTGNITTDPLVEDDDWNGFPRWWDGKLWAESPAIDQGYGSAPRLPTRDRLGNARSLGGGVDIGAFEFDADANREPRADAVEDAIIVPRGEAFTFDGSGAFDPDGFIASAYWTMSDGTVTAGQTVQHTFATDGAHWGYITIIDDEGAEDHAKVDVNVDIRPVADAGPAVFQDAGAVEPVFFDGTLSYDPDGTIVSWSWDFGDGSALATEQSPRHSYDSAGTYIVTLTVTDNEGLTDTDTTLATVFGVEDDVGPLVLHDEIVDGQPIGSPVLISAEITDPSEVAYAYVFYRPIGDAAAAFLAMSNTGGDTYEAVIPGTAVTAAGVEYWIQTADGADPANDAIWPAGAPTTAIWDFLVTGDPDPPSIAHTEIADGQTNGEAVTIAAEITDATGVASANLYFRTTGAASFGAVSMVNTTGDSWSAQVPGFVVAPPGVEYYIEATDTSPIPNTGYGPTTAPGTPYAFTVTSGDTVAPIIAHTPIGDGQPAGTAVVVTAGVADTGGSVASATVYYRTAGTSDAFASTALVHGTGTNWSGAIPAGAVVTPGVEYYVSASDDSDNVATDPDTAPTVVHTFVVTEVDTAGPEVTHTPVADGQAAGVAVTVTATATDPSGVDRVQLRYRPSGFPIFSTVEMTAVGAGVYQADIPAFSVNAPGVEYYLRAFDAEDNETRVPADGETAPFSFTVVAEDVTAPTIVHAEITDEQTAGVDVTVAATILDASDVTASVYYRADGATEWTAAAMTEVGDDAYEATIPGASVAEPSVEYYIAASDASDNDAASPAAAPASFHEFPVVAADIEGPTIVHTPLAGPVDYGSSQNVSAVVFDPSGVAEVTLSYRTLGDVDWTVVAMGAVGANTYAADIPSEDVVDPGLEYFVFAADLADAANENTAPAAGAGDPYTVVVEPLDTDGPEIVHAPTSSLNSGDDLDLVAIVTDATSVAGVTVHWSADGVGQAPVAMSAAGDTWSATIAWADVPADTVEIAYYITAVDALDNAATAPVTAPAVGWQVDVIYPDTSGPVVEIAPIAAVTVGTPVMVAFTATDEGSGISNVVLEYRTTGTAEWTRLPVAGSGPDFDTTVPGVDVELPGLEVRVEATDGVGNMTTSGSTFVVVNAPEDLTPPTVELTPIPDGQLEGVSFEVSVVATDESDVELVTFYYRTQGATDWAYIELAAGADDRWYGDLPAGAVALPAVEYWAEATDDAPAENVGVAPDGAPDAFETFTVTASDTAGPSIAHTPPALPIVAGDTLVLRATVTDASGVDAVSAWWRNDAGAFVEAPMTAAGDVWSTGAITVPARATFDYYFVAEDTLANGSAEPPTAPVTWRSRPVEIPDVTAPEIVHTPVADGQTAGAPVAITATVTDDDTVTSVSVYYRALGAGTFTLIPMASAGGDEWTAVIPGVGVTEAGVEYYLVAADAADPANMTSSPAGAPGSVYAFTVGAVSTDTEPPAIAHSPVSGPVAAGEAVRIDAVIADASGVAAASVYFRVRGSGAWLSVALTDIGGGTWSGEIPALAVAQPGVEYYVSAEDASSAGNVGFNPVDAPGVFHDFDVAVLDTDGPSILHSPVVGPVAVGTPVPVTATASDASGVDSMALYFRTTGDTTWLQLAMTEVDGAWTATLPGPAVVTPGVDYYLRAVDASEAENTTVEPTGAPTLYHAFVTETPDTEGPSITLEDPTGPFVAGTPITLGATVTDPSGVDDVTLHYIAEGGDWAELAMAPTGDLYTATVPGVEVVEGELHYYVAARDEHDNESTAPAGADSAPEVIVVDAPVGDDLDPPTLLHSPVSSARHDQPIALAAVATDASGILSVVVYYRVLGDETWEEVAMSSTGGDGFSAEIPAAFVTSDGVEYYVVATDAAEAANAASAPAGAPDSVYEVEVIGGGGPDAGDAGPDAGDAGTDAGDAGPDAGDAGTDAGDAGTDAGDAGIDGGTDVGTDGGDTGTDAAPDAADAGADVNADASTDTGVGPIDTGFELPEDGSGCGCSSTPTSGGPLALLVAIALGFVRRRRSDSSR